MPTNIYIYIIGSDLEFKKQPTKLKAIQKRLSAFCFNALALGKHMPLNYVVKYFVLNAWHYLVQKNITIAQETCVPGSCFGMKILTRVGFVLFIRNLRIDN